MSPEIKVNTLRDSYSKFDRHDCGGTRSLNSDSGFNNFEDVKGRLRDPDSFQYIRQGVSLIKTNDFSKVRLTIYYRSKNGFGGYVNGSYSCDYLWDPRKFDYR